jgi:hypothetical protein
MKIRRVDFYPDDWLGGTAILTHEERSVYITVCACIYSRGGPVEIRHVRKFCPGHGFKRAFDGLIAKGKITRNERGEVDQKRCATELLRASKRTENGLKSDSNRTQNGPSVDSKRTEQNGESNKSPELRAPRARRRARDINHQSSKESTSSSSLPSSARANGLSGGPDHARDAGELNGGLRPIGEILGNALGGAMTPAPEPRASTHWRYLLERGRPNEATWYFTQIDSATMLPPQEIFDAIEARIQAEGWKP